MNVTVVGSGTMGNGIAHVFAQFGHDVWLLDVSQERLQTALATIEKNLKRQAEKGVLPAEDVGAVLSRIRTSTTYEKTFLEPSELVVEAATENPEVKFEIFRRLDELCGPQCILASNTSSISITRIASQTRRPEKVIGMHFMNPVPVMKLVEVIRGYSTSDAVCAQVMEISKALNKVPVEVRDMPGFVANKILMPMINEAIITLHEGTAGVEEIDTVMKLGMAHPMGPLQLADFIGLDVCLAILQVLHEGFGHPKYAPCPLLVNMVTAGKLGVKAGEGFYVYTPGSKELRVAPTFSKK
ncbi:MAG: 3-hydroxybutyryl-CoA dehydrogenase [Flavobacteriales bacterium]|nr:3-hydroxybutyryl-CoA dehydrogenase [Flavobacteriales bacterium]MDW8431936.1 3-hydroxybutyryl-CoA dehydrogenase [Flavobacteriales bacterium]